jgi:hypothetical protein
VKGEYASRDGGWSSRLVTSELDSSNQAVPRATYEAECSVVDLSVKGGSGHVVLRGVVTKE